MLQAGTARCPHKIEDVRSERIRCLQISGCSRADLVVRGAAPHVRLQRLARLQQHRLAQREEDGEPAEHVRRMRRRMDAQPHVAVQLRPASQV